MLGMTCCLPPAQRTCNESLGLCVALAGCMPLDWCVQPCLDLQKPRAQPNLDYRSVPRSKEAAGWI